MPRCRVTRSQLGTCRNRVLVLSGCPWSGTHCPAPASGTESGGGGRRCGWRSRVPAGPWRQCVLTRGERGGLWPSRGFGPVPQSRRPRCVGWRGRRQEQPPPPAPAAPASEQRAAKAFWKSAVIFQDARLEELKRELVLSRPRAGSCSSPLWSACQVGWQLSELFFTVFENLRHVGCLCVKTPSFSGQLQGLSSPASSAEPESPGHAPSLAQCRAGAQPQPQE